MRVCCALAALAVLSGCDELLGLDKVRLTPDATDAPVPDAAMPDAPTILKCGANGMITLLPTEPVALNWTDQYPASGSHLDKISETSADDDGTYIASMVDGQHDLFAHLPIDGSTTIDNVTIWARSRLEGSATPAQVGLAFMTNNVLEWDDVVLSAAWGDFSSSIYTKNPVSMQDWTVAEVNALTFGVRKTYSTHRARVTRIWATVACH